MPNPYNRRFRKFKPRVIKRTKRIVRRYRKKRITRRQRLFKDLIHTVFHINQEVVATTAGVTAVNPTINFSQFTGLITFVDGFQKFRVNKIVQKFIPEQNVNTAIIASGTSSGITRLPEWHSYRLYEPQSAPNTLAPFLAETSYRTGRFNNTKSVAGIPFIDILANPETGTTPVVAMPKRKAWLNANTINTIQMFKGYQFAIETFSTNPVNYTVQNSIYITCKHRLSQ